MSYEISPFVWQPELNEAVRDLPLVDRIVLAPNGVEKTMETTFRYETDVADLHWARFRRLRIPQRMAVTKVDELARVDFIGV